MTYPKSVDDRQRVEALHDLSILDTSSDVNLDRVTRMCQLIFDVEISTISFVDEDRQWFKSYPGLDVCETEREVAFCNYTIMSDNIFEVPDAAQDPTFANNRLVTGSPFIRYYAGAPLIFQGMRLGALCLIDSRPREALSVGQREILVELAHMVVHEVSTNRLIRKSLASIGAGASL